MKTSQEILAEIDQRIKIANVIDIIESSRVILKYELASLKAFILSAPEKCKHTQILRPVSGDYPDVCASCGVIVEMDASKSDANCEHNFRPICSHCGKEFDK